MKDFYQLILTIDPSFQRMIDELIARLALVPKVRVSKKRLVHAGVSSLRNASLEELQAFDAKLTLLNDKKHPSYPPKHAAIQVDRIFADLARLKSASMAVSDNFRRSTRHFLHYGIISLTECSDNEFEILINASVTIENSSRNDPFDVA